MRQRPPFVTAFRAFVTRRVDEVARRSARRSSRGGVHWRTLGTAGFIIAALLGVYMVLTILVSDRKSDRG